jgi:hypothetical protein
MKKPFVFAKRFVGLTVALLSATATAQSITSFTVIDADTDKDVATVASVATATLSTTPRINIRANTSNASSVAFTEGGKTTTERFAPFAFKGNSGADYGAWSPSSGVYRITAVPFGSDGKAGSASTLTLTVVAGAGGKPTYSYQVILGHDGHPDPDDNLAALAGFVAVKTAAASSSRVLLEAMIYGDTTEARHQGMIPGGAGSGSGGDDRAEANYKYFQRYTKPALQSMGLSKFYDLVKQNYNFDANALGQMTSGGRFIAQQVQAAIGGTTRVVYSAGGGANAAAEAISYLRSQGYSDTQIRNHFAIVQHSAWNWKNATQSEARTITKSFTISISDQNKDAGRGSAPRTVKASRTSETFASAWSSATGVADSGIADLEATTDASDGGSHHFASNVSQLDIHWAMRGEPGVVNAIPYRQFTTAVMNAQMN